LNQLQWLVGKRYQRAIKREYNWLFEFDDEATVAVECLWRLVINGRIRLTSQDDGQQFGHSSPLDAANELNSQLANARIVAIDLNDGTLDLAIRVDGDRTLEILPDSSGYEAWIAYNGQSQFIAIGGGDLAVVANGTPNMTNNPMDRSGGSAAS
jgi:hypothetical protein